MRPSFLGLVASGLLILVAVILLIRNYSLLRKDTLIMSVLLLSIAVSTHSLQHAVEEMFFKFNPLIGEWKPLDKPQSL